MGPGNHTGRALTVLLVLAAMPVAYAERGDVTLLYGPVTGGSFDDLDGDADLDIDAAPGAGLALHIAAPAGGQYEVLYFRQHTDIGTSTLFTAGDEIDITVEYLQIGGNYAFGDETTWQPYIALTVGAARFNPDAPGTESETFAAMTGGLGLYRAFGERVALRLEARALATWIEEDTEVFCVSAGGAVCAISAEGDTVWQWTAMVGVAFRF